MREYKLLPRNKINMPKFDHGNESAEEKTRDY